MHDVFSVAYAAFKHREVLVKDFQFTPWFNFKTDGPPHRVGWYEGAAVGIPGEGSVMQPGYYYWNGEKWTTNWHDLDGKWKGICFPAAHWRGVIPDDDYPFDQVEVSANPPIHHQGTLKREGAPADIVTVSRLRRIGTSIEIKFQRNRGNRQPDEFDCVLAKEGLEYSGRAAMHCAGFTSSRLTDLRAAPGIEDQGALAFSLSIKELGRGWVAFRGILMSP